MEAPEKPSSASGNKRKRKKKEEKEEVVECKLQCLEIDVDSVLSDVEWRNLAECLVETEGVAWF